MANQFTYQVLKDTTEHAVIKLTGKFDGSGQESNVSRIKANTLFGALDANNIILSGANTAKSYYDLTVYRVWYDVNVNGYVKMFWNGDNTYPILEMKGTGEYNNAGNWIAIKNPRLGANVTGDIGIQSFGAVANNSYSLIVELHKNNNDYDSGARNYPNDFNFGSFGVTP